MNEGSSDLYCRLIDCKIEIERLRAELNAIDKALRCEGWPLAARVERANMLSAQSKDKAPDGDHCW